jgi:hypothetical protein
MNRFIHYLLDWLFTLGFKSRQESDQASMNRSIPRITERMWNVIVGHIRFHVPHTHPIGAPGFRRLQDEVWDGVQSATVHSSVLDGIPDDIQHQ